jgi:hypothetical protein
VVNKGILIIAVILALVATSVLAVDIKDIIIAPKEIVVGASAEISVVAVSDLKIISVEGFLTLPDETQQPIIFETKDALTFTSLFDKLEKVGGYRIDVIATDEKGVTKGFAKFEVMPVPEPSLPPKNVTNVTFVDFIKQVQNVTSVRDVQFTQKVVNQTTMFVGGTEYMPFDEVKVFLQLLQGDVPINNASCYVSIYYPNNTIWQNNQSMIYQNGTNGLYWWSGVAPNVSGVYMVDSRCRYDYYQRWVYPSGTLTDPHINTTFGTMTGSISSLNDYQDSLYIQHVSDSGSGHKTDFFAEYNISDGNFTPTQIDIYWMGQSSTSDKPFVLFYVWNWTSSAWVLLPNSITLFGVKSPSIEGVNELVTNTINNGAISSFVSSGNLVRVRVLANYSQNYYLFTNWLSLSVTSPTNLYITDIRGGGELHITTPEGQAWWISIITWLTDIWNKLLGIETQLNTTINITNHSLVLNTEINQTTHNLSTQIINLNNSMWQGFAEKDAHIQSAYDNMSSQLNNFSANTTQNFNLTWQMIQALNSTQGQNNSAILSYLANITLALNNTQTQLSAVNQSLSEQILNTSNNTQTLITTINSSTQARFDQIQSYLTNLTILINNNHNITQQNISALMEMLVAVNASTTNNIANLNTSLYDVRADLLSQINQTYNYLVAMNVSLTNDLALINASLSGAIQDFRNEAQANFSTMFLTLNGISADLNGTKAELLSGISNLSQQLIVTNTSIQLKLDAINQSMLDKFAEKDAHIQSAYNNITSQINNLSINWSGNFSVVLNKLDNLSTQIETNHNITQSNLSVINNYLTNLNASIQQGFSDLNTSIYTSINQTGENIVSEITSLRNLLLSINTSLTADIIENRNTMLLINQSLSNQIGSFENSTTNNFNTTFALLNGLEAQNNLTHALLGNLSIQLNQTQWEIDSRINIMNTSIHNRFNTIDSNLTMITNILNNISFGTNASITDILNSIANLSAQESTHHNITQQNLTTLFQKCSDLNSTMTGYYQSLYDALAQMNLTLIYINETNTWILQELNISTIDLNLWVIAPAQCLIDTNWVAKAQVRDRYGNILSYLDGIQCNMTTSLWGTSNMSYVFMEQKFKYIHQCDPTNTTFNWSVNCERVN